MKFLYWLIGLLFEKDSFNFKSQKPNTSTVKLKKDYRLKPGCKYWYFNKYGNSTGNIVFQCIARDYKNATRKFNNYKEAL